jgi:hypothetical protein
MEPEVSLPCSQEPALAPYPDPDASSLHFSILFPKIYTDSFLPSTPRSSFRFSNQTFCVTVLVQNYEVSDLSTFITHI